MFRGQDLDIQLGSEERGTLFCLPHQSSQSLCDKADKGRTGVYIDHLTFPSVVVPPASPMHRIQQSITNCLYDLLRDSLANLDHSEYICIFMYVVGQLPFLVLGKWPSVEEICYASLHSLFLSLPSSRSFSQEGCVGTSVVLVDYGLSGGLDWPQSGWLPGPALFRQLLPAVQQDLVRDWLDAESRGPRWTGSLVGSQGHKDSGLFPPTGSEARSKSQ